MHSGTVADSSKLVKIHLSRKLTRMTEQSRQPTQVTDPTGQYVAKNVRRVRERRGWSTYELSRQLKAANRPISPSALAKLERGERRVDVGDLAALAVILQVTTSALLLPLEDDPAKTVEVTGGGSVAADVAWDWADGRRPLHYDARGDDHAAALEFVLYARPPRRRGSWDALKDLITVTDHESHAAGLVQDLREEDPDGPGVD